MYPSIYLSIYIMAYCVPTCPFTKSCLILCDTTDCSPPGSSVHGISQATGVGCYFLLQEIFPTQGLISEPMLQRLLRWQADSLPLSHLGISIMEYYSAIKKNEVIPFAATEMDQEIIILREVNQTKKDKNHMDITYMQNLKNDINELIYKTDIDSQTRKQN